MGSDEEPLKNVNFIFPLALVVFIVKKLIHIFFIFINPLMTSLVVSPYMVIHVYCHNSESICVMKHNF